VDCRVRSEETCGRSFKTLLCTLQELKEREKNFLWIRINKKSNNTIVLKNLTLRQVADFTYLASNVSEDEEAVKGVNIRFQKAREAFSTFLKTGIQLAFISRAMAQVVSHRPLTAEARVRY
jgi:hypothetical protein